ncbi:MAG: biotin transporter BioY, partial [Alphaproteobacteria bacterium]|nr:biotin transporter BioY [Alphaproteobacteria bacterium]
AEGALGLPVFSRGGGLAYFAGPTSGYLFGFVAAAMLVGWLAERGWDRSISATLFAMTLGTVLIFILGVAWLSVFLMQAKGITLAAGLSAAVANGLMPFLAGAAAKIALAAAVMPYGWVLVGRYKS